VRYLAWLIHRFRGDLRLAAAAYYAGEYVIGTKGLNYKNPDVLAYVAQVRARYAHQAIGAHVRQLSEGEGRKSR
jgi:soluble lytic murein transglycosylase-like protein